MHLHRAIQRHGVNGQASSVQLIEQIIRQSVGKSQNAPNATTTATASAQAVHLWPTVRLD